MSLLISKLFLPIRFEALIAQGFPALAVAPARRGLQMSDMPYYQELSGVTIIYFDVLDSGRFPVYLVT